MAVVQEASGLDPAANRARLRDLVPHGRRPGRAARGVRPRLRRGRLRRQRVRRAAGRAVRGRGRAGGRATGARPSSPGCSRPPRTRPVRTTPWWSAAARERGVPQDPPLRLLRLPRVRRAHAGTARAGDRGPRRLPARADDLLRPALPRAGPGAGRRAAPRSSSSRRPGSPGRARSTTGAPWCAPGRSRTPCTSSPRPSPDRGTPATRWSSTRSATSWPRPATGPDAAAGHADPGGPGRGPAPRTRRWPTDACTSASPGSH